MENQECGQLRALVVIMLSWIMLCFLISKFSPIPFIGTVMSLALYPLVKKITWIETLEMFLAGHIFNILVNMDTILGSLQVSVEVSQLSGFAFDFGVWSPAIYLLMIPYAAISQAVAVKLLGKYGKPPKMIRRLGI